MTDVEAILRANIHRHMRTRGWSLGETAAQCGHSGAWLSRIINPPDHEPGCRGMRLPDLAKVAAVFGVEPYELLKPTRGRSRTGTTRPR